MCPTPPKTVNPTIVAICGLIYWSKRDAPEYLHLNGHPEGFDPDNFLNGHDLTDLGHKE